MAGPWDNDPIVGQQPQAPRQSPAPQQPDAPWMSDPAGGETTPAPQGQPPSDAPSDAGFTDEQKQQILSYIPKARDAADLEQFSNELSGGHAHLGNAQAVLDQYQKGHREFSWQPPVAAKDQKINVTPHPLRDAVGEGILGAIDQLFPGVGSLMRDNRDVGRAFVGHVANAVAADYGPEVGGLIHTITDGGDLDRNVAHERATLEGYSQGHEAASALGELAGIGLTAPLSGAVADAARLGKVGRVAQMSAEGAAFGSGAAGPDERVPGAVAGAVLAPVGAAAVKGALAVPGLIKGGAQTVMEGSPGLARKIISRAIKDDANTPETVANDIAAAHSNNVPMALADTGENVRGLLAASSRASGMARTVARDALEERQSGLADRVTNAIQRDLGPVANPHHVADELMTKARTEAAPLYASAYAKPGAASFSQKVAPLLERPSLKKALAYAYRTAQEEGRNPEELGLQAVTDRTTSILDANGNHITVPEVTMSPNPTWQTLDYVKRGADDVIEGYKNKVTGKYDFDTEGNAANNTLRSFLKAFDVANPDYAAARNAYAGPVKGIAAMNTGRKFLNMTADDIEARMRDMTPYEKDMAALGTRRAMAELVQSKGDSADVVHALVGTGKKRAMLARLFGDRKAFQRFVDTLGQEREGFRTFKQGLLGSPTAANLSDDAALQTAATATDLVLAGGMPIATATSKAIKFLGVKIGKKAQEDIAAMLSNTDPAAIRELAAELRAKAEKRGLHVPNIRAVGKSAGNATAVAIPRAASQ